MAFQGNVLKDTASKNWKLLYSTNLSELPFSEFLQELKMFSRKFYHS